MLYFLVLYLKLYFTKSMTGANCSIFGCIKSRTTKGLAIFGIPKKDDEWHRDWREKLVNIITIDREIDADLKGQIERKSLHIFELHLTEDQLIRRKFKYTFFAYHAYLITNCEKEFSFN